MALSAYHVAYQIVRDFDLHVRVAAAAQQEYERAEEPPPGQEPEAVFDPEAWAFAHAWEYGTQTDWVEAVMYALDTGDTEWGKDPGVITDQHILSFVQSAIA